MISGFIIAAVKFILVISFLVLIHEAGHFLTAKAVGIKVNEFAIGFGPKLFSKQKGETKYSIRCLPLGGYVAMEGEEEASDDPRAFNNKPVWARMLVVVMGGLVNIIFAIVVIFIMTMSNGTFESRIVEKIGANTAGAKAGIQVGDEVVAINGKPMRVMDDIVEYLRVNKQKPVTVKVKRNGELLEYNLVPDKQELGLIGIALTEDGATYSNVIKDLEKNSPAIKVGMQVGDKITSVAGIETTDPAEIMTIIALNSNKEIPVKILRDTQEIEFLVTPITPEILARYVIGFNGTTVTGSISARIYNAFWQSMAEVRSMYNQVIELLSGKIDTKYLSGPVGIAKVVGETNGFKDLLSLIVFISLNLGIVNLLPFPPLDGGKMVFLLIELIRRKPIKEEIEAYFQLAGFSLLILLMIFVTFNDVTGRASLF